MTTTHVTHPQDGPITLIAATSRAHARAIVQATNRRYPAAPCIAWVATPNFAEYCIVCRTEHEGKVLGIMSALEIQEGLDAIERNYKATKVGDTLFIARQ